MSEETGKFEYFISRKGEFVVIAFVGRLNREAIAPLEKCVSEILVTNSLFCVLSLQDVTAVEAQGIPAFVRLQKTIRDKGAILRVCSVQPHVRKPLADRGAIRESEITSDLAEALMKLKSAMPQKAAA